MKRQTFYILLSLLLAFIVGLSFSLYHQQKGLDDFEEIRGRVRVYHSPATLSKQLIGNPRAGEIVYYSYCSHCHAAHPEIPIHAPRVDQPKLWQAISSLGKKRLLKLTVDGAGAMPARGGCFECDDHSLMMAIEYMISVSKRHR